MNIIQMDRLAFTVRDLDASLAFYVGMLKLECKRQGGGAVLQFGSSKLVLRVPSVDNEPGPVNRNAVGSQNFCVRAQGDPDELLTELLACGARVVEPCVATRQGALGEMRSVYLFDPDFNLVEIGIYESTSQPFQVTDLDHAVLIADDLDVTMAFYRDTIGLIGTCSDGHGTLKIGAQKFNIHHKKPRYVPHEPFAATGSVEYRLVVNEGAVFQDRENIWTDQDGHICFHDPDGNLGVLVEQRHAVLACVLARL